MVIGASAGADEIGPEAFGIRVEPKPGPVEEFQPIKALPAVPFELPFDWGMDPFNDNPWQRWLHKLDMVDPVLAAGDFGYARRVFRDWQRWHQEREAPRSWATGVTGTRAAKLAYLRHATGRRDRSLAEMAEEHAAKLQEPGFLQGDHNHGIMQLRGLAALCLDRNLRSCRGSEAFLERKLPVLLRRQFTKSGVHRENSPGYHFLATKMLSVGAPILGEYASGFDQMVRRAKKQEKWLVHPDLTTVPLGDSQAAKRDLRLPRGDDRCVGVRAYSEASGCYKLKRFKGVGYVIVRSDWAMPAEDASMLFIQGGYFNGAHRDADDFSFDWFEHGRKILSDSGQYAYTGDKWNEYFNSTRAHNTVEVDGRNFSTEQEDAYGDAVKVAQKTSNGIRVIMQVHHPDLQFWHRRQIDYRPGEELGIRDAVRSDRPRVYVQWHHAARAFELSGNGGRFELDDGDMLVELETRTSCGPGTKYRKIKGQLEPRMQGWASLSTRERHERWALGVECQAQNATFEARFAIKSR